ncbi:glycosyltransferase family 22 protein [Amylocarpus encephaloides]|uniref:Mannosyltransferase n=1 Tax=Amylocarpus encephaloides TaxID=45428 RepID=A0A9P8C9P3_9HELO|nr:glycosyltransferase family 22 protein [Amylocarpus encephaloides]
MKPIDAVLVLLIPTFILLHLLVAPYTKVEESFNIQAIHDITKFGLPLRNISSALQAYDHATFPGAVPRTFIGALALAGVSKPMIAVAGWGQAQLSVRAALGLFNAACLWKYERGLRSAFGPDVGRWYVLLQATQFHVIYYASRTLPNMLAFGLTTLAFGQFLPRPGRLDPQRQRRGIAILVFAAVVFRSEIALLLATQVLSSLLQSRISLQAVITTGIVSGLLSVTTTTLIDSYFWQKPLWPELWGFYYNVFEGKSSDWGTSPFMHYFTSLLPKLLLNPLIQFMFIPMAVVEPATKIDALNLVIPSLLFIAIYSIQPHKEARFIIYVVPQLTAAASLSASWIWTRRSKNPKYTIGAILLVLSLLGSFVASTAMLLVSSLNYPGGEAIASLHKILTHTPWPEHSNDSIQAPINIHMDVLSCMTGVTRFHQLAQHDTSSIYPLVDGKNFRVHYDKTENSTILLAPSFWAQFDYALMEDPSAALGNWEIVDTIFAYSGIELLRPKDGSSFSEHLERVYAAEEGDGEGGQEERMRIRAREMNGFGTFNLLRDGVRSVTGGWWVGPRMRPSVRILRRVKD